ncbi:hypothetical protein M8312_04480 [Sphingomonas sp. KRR8]|uniref:hypothetical protein n=1 Tax=Sphingomonas sp. KRR8 TaxID=2942996 RepID=UPI0020217BB5|nr:hypothetical protein [Sphingomonas sp. KRR8]URD61776.1 hypothetical protein M8312_04480 [Sphingomonas sp. KRR8]
MKKLLLLIGLSLTASPSLAHPTGVLFDTFAQCNSALHQQDKTDRIRVGSFFPSNGAAEINMLNNWECVYDADLDAWHMSGQPFGGDLLGGGNGKADPGTPNG